MSLSRKQRRLAEKNKSKSVAPVTSGPAADKAAFFKAQGMALKEAGKYAEAVPFLIDALKNDSSLADVHFTLAMMVRTKPELGIDIEKINSDIKNKALLIKSYHLIVTIMRQKRQYDEAMICQEEILRLNPQDILTRMDLGLLQNMAGRNEDAVVNMAQAFLKDTDNKVIKGVFSTSLNAPTFTKFHPEVKRAMIECFRDNYDVHLRNFWQPWFHHMMVDPIFRPFLDAQICANNDDFKVWAESLDDHTGAFLKDPYFIGGLRMLTIADPLIETVLTRLRRYLALNLPGLMENGRFPVFREFLYALAEQCFFNEYVYNVEPDEEDAVSRFISAPASREIVALTACYRPLYRTFAGKSDQLHAFAAGHESFARLIKTQLDDPVEESRIKAAIPAFGAIANSVSGAVQSQYEENPYPRWVALSTTPLPQDELLFDEKQRELPFKILIAGCGTGRHALGTAIRYPNAKVTAIDLSRASLAYGIRKATEAGFAHRISFVHADILSMAEWPDDFDIIECAGVLHHMEDPFRGWETLNSRLKKGGLFKIGLYSDIARQPIVQARAFIAAHGFPSTAEGIRACRREILSLPKSDPIRQFVGHSLDFYTTSAVRDLIFHVQEHRMTLPQIEDMMNRLGLACLRFAVPSHDTIYKYDKMFPEDKDRKNLKNWEIFEKKFPLTFAGMYQFWCQKVK